MDIHSKRIADSPSRRSFIGGSDARIIMGQDEKALIRLWHEKRGEVAPEDLSTKDTHQINRSGWQLIAGGWCSSIRDGMRRPGCRASSSQRR